jgi:phytoene desaturase
VFSFHPLLVGGNPFQTTVDLRAHHTLEREWGVWFAMGGTGALVQALVQAVRGHRRHDPLSPRSEITVDRARGARRGVMLRGRRALPPTRW